MAPKKMKANSGFVYGQPIEEDEALVYMASYGSDIINIFYTPLLVSNDDNFISKAEELKDISVRFANSTKSNMKDMTSGGVSITRKIDETEDEFENVISKEQSRRIVKESIKNSASSLASSLNSFATYTDEDNKNLYQEQIKLLNVNNAKSFLQNVCEYPPLHELKGMDGIIPKVKLKDDMGPLVLYNESKEGLNGNNKNVPIYSDLMNLKWGFIKKYNLNSYRKKYQAKEWPGNSLEEYKRKVYQENNMIIRSFDKLRNLIKPDGTSDYDAYIDNPLGCIFGLDGSETRSISNAIGYMEGENRALQTGWLPNEVSVFGMIGSINRKLQERKQKYRILINNDRDNNKRQYEENIAKLEAFEKKFNVIKNKAFDPNKTNYTIEEKKAITDEFIDFMNDYQPQRNEHNVITNNQDGRFTANGELSEVFEPIFKYPNGYSHVINKTSERINIRYDYMKMADRTINDIKDDINLGLSTGLKEDRNKGYTKLCNALFANNWPKNNETKNFVKYIYKLGINIKKRQMNGDLGTPQNLEAERNFFGMINRIVDTKLTNENHDALFEDIKGVINDPNLRTEYSIGENQTFDDRRNIIIQTDVIKNRCDSREYKYKFEGITGDRYKYLKNIYDNLKVNKVKRLGITFSNTEKYNEMVEAIGKLVKVGPEDKLPAYTSYSYNELKKDALNKIKDYMSDKKSHSSNIDVNARRDAAVLATAMIDPVKGVKLLNAVNNKREANKKIKLEELKYKDGVGKSQEVKMPTV